MCRRAVLAVPSCGRGTRTWPESGRHTMMWRPVSCGHAGRPIHGCPEGGTGPDRGPHTWGRRQLTVPSGYRCMMRTARRTCSRMAAADRSIMVSGGLHPDYHGYVHGLARTVPLGYGIRHYGAWLYCIGYAGPSLPWTSAVIRHRDIRNYQAKPLVRSERMGGCRHRHDSHRASGRHGVV